MIKPLSFYFKIQYNYDLWIGPLTLRSRSQISLCDLTQNEIVDFRIFFFKDYFTVIDNFDKIFQAVQDLSNLWNLWIACSPMCVVTHFDLPLWASGNITFIFLSLLLKFSLFYQYRLCNIRLTNLRLDRRGVLVLHWGGVWGAHYTLIIIRIMYE